MSTSSAQHSAWHLRMCCRAVMEQFYIRDPDVASDCSEKPCCVGKGWEGDWQNSELVKGKVGKL